MLVEKKDNLSFPKHSASIAISGKLSTIQRKVFNLLIINARNTKPDKNHIYSISLNRLKSYLGIPDNDKNNTHLKKRIEEIMKIVVKFDLFHKDTSYNWVAAPLLAGAQIKNGVLRYSFSHFLEEKLLNPNIFTVLNMYIIKGLSSKYSIALYENIKDFSGSEFPEITLDLFRELMGVEKNKYKSISDLKKRVIEPAVKEINQKTDIFISYELRKEGRKYKYIKFFIKPSTKADKKEIEDFNKRISKLAKVFKGEKISIDVDGIQREYEIKDIFFDLKDSLVIVELESDGKKKFLKFSTLENAKEFLQKSFII